MAVERTHLGVICTGASGALGLPTHLAQWRRVVDAPVRLLLTRSALGFVNPDALRWLADEVIEPGDRRFNPVGFGKTARLLVICPATTNFVVSAALGLAATPALTALLAHGESTLFFPHTDPVMWSAETTRDAVDRLRDLGHTVVSPEREEAYRMFDRTFAESRPMPQPARTAEIVGKRWADLP
ncbi:flavoprotein [Micromonospora sp. SH-82]|uniref:flavoprotein n=1 Tax=Micromonospora sp. SH-82 TaxID=3132938 RepID=UPI003EBC1823